MKPVSPEQAAEYKLVPTFYKKATLVQGILIATSANVPDVVHLEAAYQFDMVMRSIEPEVAQYQRAAPAAARPGDSTRLPGISRCAMGSFSLSHLKAERSQSLRSASGITANQVISSQPQMKVARFGLGWLALPGSARRNYPTR